MQVLGPDAKVDPQAQAEAMTRADGRGDFVVLWNYSNVSGALSKDGADEKRDALLAQGYLNVQVLRVIEDYEV